jgi:aspartate aminotransferase-like enzyme
MGNVDLVELLGVSGALELVLSRAGHDFTIGDGVRAALEELVAL